MKYGMITEMILKEVGSKKKIFCNKCFQYFKNLWRRGYFRDERFSKKQIFAAFHKGVLRQYIEVDRRFNRVEISLTRRGERKLEREKRGIYGKDVNKYLLEQELGSYFTGPVFV